MAKETRLLRKMYLLSDASVQKLKELDDVEKAFTTLDKKMKQILYNKKLSGHTKWLLYSNLLQKYDALRRRMGHEYDVKIQSSKKNDSEVQTDNANKTNPFNQNIHDNIPDLNDLDFSNDFEQRNNSEFYNGLENHIIGEGELEQLSPQSSRRLTAFSTASASKKSVVPLRHHLMQDPSWLGDDSHNLMNPDNTILEEEESPVYDEDRGEEEPNEEYRLPPPPKKQKNSVSIELKGHVYSIHKDDVDDFRDFAAEEFTTYPKQEKLMNSRFQMWKKRKNKEFEELMKAEKIMIEKEKKRKRIEEAALAKKMENNRREEEKKRREEERALHWSGTESVSSKNRKSKSPVAKQKTKSRGKEQLSVAAFFPKTKQGPARMTTRSNFQKGGGIVKWFRMK